MICYYNCYISIVFIISMIYNQFTMNMKTIHKHYEQYDKLKYPYDKELTDIYQKIIIERRNIYFMGYIIGFLFSIIVSIHLLYRNKKKINRIFYLCLIVSICFITNYMYYILTPKSTYLIEHMKNIQQCKQWLIIYRKFQIKYHVGILLGLIAAAFFGNFCFINK